MHARRTHSASSHCADQLRSDDAAGHSRLRESLRATRACAQARSAYSARQARTQPHARALTYCLPAQSRLLAGALAKQAASCVLSWPYSVSCPCARVQPLELLKTRFQIHSGASLRLIPTLKEIIREGGLMRLYRGGLPEITGTKTRTHTHTHTDTHTRARAHANTEQAVCVCVCVQVSSRVPPQLCPHWSSVSEHSDPGTHNNNSLHRKSHAHCV